MVQKYEVTTTAERYIYNELSNCAHWFYEAMEDKFASGKTTGCALDMMATLVFTAFSNEAKINFVGFKVLEDGWPERANLREKIDLLRKVLPLKLDWSERPLQSVNQLRRFRDTLAHGKPEIVKKTEIVDVEPEIWDALKSQWERTVTPEFVRRCRSDEETLWEQLLCAAKIPLHRTLTQGGHQLTVLQNG